MSDCAVSQSAFIERTTVVVVAVLHLLASLSPRPRPRPRPLVAARMTVLDRVKRFLQIGQRIGRFGSLAVVANQLIGPGVTLLPGFVSARASSHVRTRRSLARSLARSLLSTGYCNEVVLCPLQLP